MPTLNFNLYRRSLDVSTCVLRVNIYQKLRRTFIHSRTELIADTTAYHSSTCHESCWSISPTMLYSGSMLSLTMMRHLIPYHSGISLWDVGLISRNTCDWNLGATCRLMRSTPMTCRHVPLELYALDPPEVNRVGIISCP
jgi:hypothetical protein